MSTATHSDKPTSETARRAVIRLEEVRKDFSSTRALDGVDLEVTRGEVLVLVGLSGSGKSTLLRHLNGLDTPTSGTVEVLGERLTALRPAELRALRGRVAMIFQQFELVPSLTVLENVLTGALSRLRGPRLGLSSYPKALRRAALENLERVGLLPTAYKRADELSGGQQQRVAIARALLQEPEVLLADEPVASLDPESSDQVMRLIREIATEDSLTVICSLHQVDLALAWGERIVGLRDGRTVLDTPALSLDRRTVMDIYQRVDPEQATGATPYARREERQPMGPRRAAASAVGRA